MTNEEPLFRHYREKSGARILLFEGLTKLAVNGERMLPQRARQLYPTLNEDDLQWPELMDFRRDPATAAADDKAH
jgi:hypothetical protein